MNERSALVTGGAGFIGSHLVDGLLDSGYRVTVLDDLSTGSIENVKRHVGKKKFRLVKGSITDRKTVRESLRGMNVVFHYAAITSVSRSLSHPRPVNRVNADGTLLLLDETRSSSAKRFVFASSAAVYGSGQRVPIEEGAVLNPDSPYGASKIAGEAYCNSFFRAYGIETVILRCFNVYGPRSTAGHYGGVMMHFAHRLTKGLPLEVFGDGTQTRDFVFVGDVVRANLIAARSGSVPGETFNVGTGKETSINALAGIFQRSSLAPKKTRVVHLAARPGEIRHSVASIGKAKKVMGYTPGSGVVEGIRRFLSWYSARSVGLRGR